MDASRPFFRTGLCHRMKFMHATPLARACRPRCAASSSSWPKPSAKGSHGSSGQPGWSRRLSIASVAEHVLLHFQWLRKHLVFDHRVLQHIKLTEFQAAVGENGQPHYLEY